MKTFIETFLLIIPAFLFSVELAAQEIRIIDKPSEKKLEVLVDGELFTSYIYYESIKKPVLWPVISPAGNILTRSFPLEKVPGERVDHPHHIGIWLNYGNVNDLDFWNNSEAIPVERRDKFGTIFHRKVEEVKSGKGKGFIRVKADWVSSGNNTLLEEETEFIFGAKKNIRIIDRITKLTAINDILFKDNKEGLFAIRVCPELEFPHSRPIELTDAHGNITDVKVMGNPESNGNYLSSEGVEGAKVWGTRAGWMKLSGIVKGEEVSIIIVDHPDNPGYPTYWHARTYGLFSANSLGQKEFSNGENELNFTLKKGDSATFRYRLIVYSGKITVQKINKLANKFQGSYR